MTVACVSDLAVGMPLNLTHSPAGSASKEKGVGLGAGIVDVGTSTVGNVECGAGVSMEVGMHPPMNNKITRANNDKGFIAKESPVVILPLCSL